MNLTMWLYLVDVVGNLRVYFAIGAMAGGVLLVGTLIASSESIENQHAIPKTWYRWFYSTLSLLIISSFMSIVLPTTKTLYLMVGVKAAEEIANNPAIQKIGSHIMLIIDEKLNALSPIKDTATKENK